MLGVFAAWSHLSSCEREATAICDALEADGLGISDAALGRPSEPYVAPPEFPALEELPRILTLGLWRANPADVLLLVREPENPIVSWSWEPVPPVPDTPREALELGFAHSETFWPQLQSAIDSGAFARNDWNASFRGPRPVDRADVLGVIQLRIAHFVDRGQHDLAWAEAVRMLEFVHDRQAGVLLEWLVRDAMLAIAGHSLIGLLQLSAPPSPEVADRVTELLLALEDPAPLTYSLRREYRSFLDFLGPDADLQELSEFCDVSPRTVSLYVSYWKPQVAGAFSTLIRASTLPPQEALAAFRAERELLSRNPRNFLGLHVSSVAGVYEVHLGCVAVLRIAQVALRLAGETELPSSLPKGFPVDPWSSRGGLIRYHRTSPTAATIWSVGSDHVDLGPPPTPAELLDFEGDLEQVRGYVRIGPR